MKIGVNLTHLTKFNSGAKTHFINLFEEILSTDLKNDYYFFLSKEMKLEELSFLKKNNTFLVYTNLPQQSAPGSLSFLRFFVKGSLSFLRDPYLSLSFLFKGSLSCLRLF